MRIIVVMDMADTSTREVGRGMYDGLVSLGHDVAMVPIHSYWQLLIRGFDDILKVPQQLRAHILTLLNQIIYAQVGLHRADMLLVITGWNVGHELLANLKDTFGTYSVVYLTESPYLSEAQMQIVPDYDLVLNNDTVNMAELEAIHDNVAYFPHSYNPDIHYPRRASVPSGIDLFWCGTAFDERKALFEAVDYGEAVAMFAGIWPDPGKSPLCDSIVPRTLPNAALPVYYSQAAINLNIHRTSKEWIAQTGGAVQQHIEKADSLNPRVYEVLGSGGFLLTDHRGEMDGWLRDGQELVLYGDADDLSDKIRFYLRHPEERERIARRGHEAVKRCTFAARCKEILFPRMEVRA